MKTEVFGKTILAGEHSVLRGVPALVFPVLNKSLTVEHIESTEPVTVEFSGEFGSELQLLFWGVIERGVELAGHKRDEVRGHFKISNSVPVGAGLGASATLCVGIGRWFHWKGWIPEDGVYEFSRQLENLFHGESSGADIAVAMSGQAMHFERKGERYAIDPLWEPRLYLSYTGKRGVTSECINRVKALWANDPAEGQAIDDQMRSAVAEAEEALREPSSDIGFERLAQALNKACECFNRWSLTDGISGEHLQMLRSHGAVAVKPTGSGDGGYALSLWRHAPPAALSSVLIPISRR